MAHDLAAAALGLRAAKPRPKFPGLTGHDQKPFRRFGLVLSGKHSPPFVQLQQSCKRLLRNHFRHFIMPVRNGKSRGTRSFVLATGAARSAPPPADVPDELARGLHVRTLGPASRRLDGLPFDVQRQAAQTDLGPMPAFAAARRRQLSDWKALPPASHDCQFLAVMPDRLPLSSGTTDNGLTGYRRAALRRPRWPSSVFCWVRRMTEPSGGPAVFREPPSLASDPPLDPPRRLTERSLGN